MAGIIFFVLFGIVTPLIFGAILSIMFYSLFAYFKNKRLKSKYLNKYKGDNKFLANPGNTTKNEKEVKEDDERRFTKYREFEKLRSLAQPINRFERDTNRAKPLPKLEQFEPRQLLQNDADFINSANTPKPRESEYSVGQNSESGKRPKLKLA